MATVNDSTNNNIQNFFNDKNNLIHKNMLEISNEKEFIPGEITYNNIKK